MTTDAGTISKLLFLIGALGLLLMQLRVFFGLRRAARHDRVLFRFCQIRRDAMALLRARFEANALTAAQYRSVRLLLICLNGTIHHYHGQGAVLFNLRAVRREFQKYGITAARLRRIADNPEIAEAMRAADGDAGIRKLYDDFAAAHVRAVVAYTPFFVLLFLESVLKLLAANTAKKLSAVRDVKEDARRFGVAIGFWRAA